MAKRVEIRRYEGDRIELMEKALLAAGALTGARASGHAVSPEMAREANAQIRAALDGREVKADGRAAR